MDKGYNVIAIGPEDTFSDQAEKLGCKYIKLKNLDQSGTNPLSDLSLVSEFRSIFKKEDVDYALTYTIKPNVYGSLATKGIKTKTIATVNGLGYTFYKTGLIKAIIKSLYRFAFNGAHRVIFQNGDDRQFFLDENLVDKEKTMTVNGSGVNLSKFSQKSTFNTESEKLIFMMSARLIKEKGVYQYYEAADIVKKKYPNTSFLLYGITSENPNSLKEEDVYKMSETGAAKFQGVTFNMSKTLEEIDVLVLPSWYREGIPRILLEGLSKGLPLITCNTVGCKETVEEGKNGFLIPPQNAEALADTMIKMIKMSPEQRKEMGEKSRQKAEVDFSEKSIINIYLKELQTASESQA